MQSATNVIKSRKKSLKFTQSFFKATKSYSKLPKFAIPHLPKQTLLRMIELQSWDKLQRKSRKSQNRCEFSYILGQQFSYGKSSSWTVAVVAIVTMHKNLSYSQYSVTLTVVKLKACLAAYKTILNISESLAVTKRLNSYSYLKTYLWKPAQLE